MIIDCDLHPAFADEGCNVSECLATGVRREGQVNGTEKQERDIAAINSQVRSFPLGPNTDMS